MALRLAKLDAADRLSIDAVRLASDGVGNSRRRHEVALIRRVDEDLAAIDIAGKRLYGDDASALRFHAVSTVEPFAAPDVECIALLPAFEDRERGGRFERPHGVLAHRSCGLAVRLVLLRRLPRPVCALGVPLGNILVELERNAAERGLVADVGLAESARRKPADARLRRDDDGGLAHAPGLHRRRDRRRTRTIDYDIAIERLHRPCAACGEHGRRAKRDNRPCLHGLVRFEVDIINVANVEMLPMPMLPISN